MSMNSRSATFPICSVPKGSWIQVCKHGQAQERLPTMQAGQQREGVPSSHWLSRVCLCTSLHAPSPAAPWEASAVVCGLAAGRERQGRVPGMGLLPSACMSLWQTVRPLKILS